MILDKIQNANLYKGVHTGISKALEYLENTKLSDLAPGRYDFEDDTFYVMVFEYETKNAEGNLLESHIKYIDVHYVVEGIEQIGVTTLVSQKPTKIYDTVNDYALFKEQYDLIKLKKGMFAIFFPDDLHMPGIESSTVSKVKKIVVKVKK